MKKNFVVIFLFIFTFFATILLSACDTSSKTHNKLVVYTSFYPLFDFVQRVGGDDVEVINLVRPGMEAHGFEPDAKQIVGMAKADLIVINGANMENWMQKLPNNIQNKILDTSESVQLINRTSNDNSQHQASDPHIWLSIKNAIKQMESIKNRLISLDNKNKSSYENRFEAASLMFNNLESTYQNLLSPENLQSNVLIVSHRAFGYLANDYNLFQYSISGIETDIEPLPSVMAEIIDYINQNNIRAVFYQTYVNSQAAETIATSTNAKLYKLSTLETLTEQELARGENYVTIMYQNLINLKNALGHQNQD